MPARSNYLGVISVEFLEESADGLRSAYQANTPGEYLISSRSALLLSLETPSRKHLDIPGVYLLLGPPLPLDDNPEGKPRLYIGQADSVADRLDNHLKHENKKWWRTVVVIKRPDKSPLDLSQCQFLESKLYSLAKKGNCCRLMNKNEPRAAFLGKPREQDTEEFLDKTRIILTALGFDFFTTRPEPALALGSSHEEVGPTSTRADTPPLVAENLRPLFEEIKKTVTGPPFSRAEWYWTRTPDYRAKVVNNGSFRVFLRIILSANSMRLRLKDIGEFRMSKLSELEEHREDILASYRKAEEYLQRGK